MEEQIAAYDAEIAKIVHRLDRCGIVCGYNCALEYELFDLQDKRNALVLKLRKINRG